MVLELLLGTLGLGVATSGWIFAYRARGEARDALVDLNRAFDRERTAAVDRDAANTKVMQADARATASEVQRAAGAEEARRLRAELDSARRERTALYERLAAAGAPVGDALFDLALDRVYPDQDGRPAGASGGEGSLPGHHDDPVGVPPDPADPAKSPR